MPVSMTCKGCKSTLKVRDDLAGKKVKCPRCASVLIVPRPKGEDFATVEVVDERISDTPAHKGRKPPPRDEEDEDDRPRKGKGKGTGIRTDKDRGRKGRSRYEEEEDDDKPKKKYKPCPRCGATGAKRVLWTPWGSFYGPALFSHVRCPECDYCYNGKSGRSNMIPAAIFVTVPLIGVIGIIAGVFYMLRQRGYL
jgi:hypothetical protein